MARWAEDRCLRTSILAMRCKRLAGPRDFARAGRPPEKADKLCLGYLLGRLLAFNSATWSLLSYRQMLFSEYAVRLFTSTLLFTAFHSMFVGGPN
jgi:hypothetical protein